MRQYSRYYALYIPKGTNETIIHTFNSHNERDLWVSQGTGGQRVSCSADDVKNIRRKQANKILRLKEFNND